MRESTCHGHFRYLWQQKSFQSALLLPAGHLGLLPRHVWIRQETGETGQALGPSGEWDAHGEPWLWQTEEMVMGFSSLPPSSHSVCSPSLTWAARLRRGAPIELSGLCLPLLLFLFQPLAPAHICREGNKSFWQLGSRRWQPGAPSAAEELSSCAPAVRVFDAYLHPATSSAEVSALV